MENTGINHLNDLLKGAVAWYKAQADYEAGQRNKLELEWLNAPAGSEEEASVKGKEAYHTGRRDAYREILRDLEVLLSNCPEG